MRTSDGKMIVFAVSDRQILSVLRDFRKCILKIGGCLVL